LVTDKNDTLVKYATGGIEEQLFVKKYLLKLPDEEALKKAINRYLKN